MGDSGDNNNNNDDVGSCCSETQQAFLFLYAVYLACALLVGDNLLARPIRLLATAVHELSHAGACWATGGTVLKLEVYENAGGATHYRRGWRWLIAPAGYLGEAFWGMVFVVLSGGRRTATVAAIGLVSALVGSLFYKPNRVLIGLTVLYAVVTIAVVVVEWFYFTPILAYVILLFGVFLGTYACVDIFQHLILLSREGSDSYSAYEESGRCCPPRCIGIFWLFLAVVLQLLGLWLALILMSDECQGMGWFVCIAHSKLDLEMERWDWWPEEWGWDQH